MVSLPLMQSLHSFVSPQRIISTLFTTVPEKKTRALCSSPGVETSCCCVACNLRRSSARFLRYTHSVFVLHVCSRLLLKNTGVVLDDTDTDGPGPTFTAEVRVINSHLPCVAGVEGMIHAHPLQLLLAYVNV